MKLTNKQRARLTVIQVCAMQFVDIVHGNIGAYSADEVRALVKRLRRELKDALRSYLRNR
jgi:hypothetical protein